MRILPRWVIVLIDLFIVAFSTFTGYMLRFNFDLSQSFSYQMGVGVLINTFACLGALLITKSYAGIVRYTGLKDGLRVFQTLIITHFFTAFVNLIYFYNYGKNLIPYSVIFISLLAAFVLLFQYRLLIKNIFSYYGTIYKNKVNAAIFGAGQMGLITKHLFDDDTRSEYNIHAFIEDDPNKIGKNINGTSIYKLSQLPDLIAKFKIDEVIIAVNSLTAGRKNEIVDFCLKYNLKIKRVPELNSWVAGELSVNQIKEIRIEDLLERDSINLQNQALSKSIGERTILVSGAAGSIGSELVRQIVAYDPNKLILIDQAESSLYELFRDLNFPENVQLVLADISDRARLESVFAEFRPNIIYHAAAYKHVPLVEDNPYEAVKCNIIGTRNLADLAVKFNAERFVMVSTDKAVNPTNVMGASKRMAEMYVQSLNDIDNKTAFITTRFGNVLGSNGSVIPFFKKQIEKGGPITVTHPDITRYFMTISEACELILEAGHMGKGGEIFLFDMGKSVKIVDLARKMVKLSGLTPYMDIDIVYTGLRNGEKLYEELLASKENSLPTHHDKIMIAKVQKVDYNVVSKVVDNLIILINQRASDISLVAEMKMLIPEFKSNHSVYEVLDKN